MVAESTELAQVKDPMASISAEDNAVQTSVSEPSVVEFVTAPIAAEPTTITVLEMSAMILVSIEPAACLVSAHGELAPASADITRTIVERGSKSALVELSPAMDIMEELAHQMVQQFFTSMKSCIELVLSERNSFEFTWMLLENQIENICRTGSSEQARAYLTLVEQLGICLMEVKTLGKASPMDQAQTMLNKLLIAQEHESIEMEEQMAKEARHLHNFQDIYQ